MMTNDDISRVHQDVTQAVTKAFEEKEESGAIPLIVAALVNLTVLADAQRTIAGALVDIHGELVKANQPDPVKGLVG